jgi:hypothetical protein
VTFSSAILGFLMGFGFGVGCALAVMYSIFLGGYRAAVQDSLNEEPPKRFAEAREKAQRKLTDIAR